MSILVCLLATACGEVDVSSETTETVPESNAEEGVAPGGEPDSSAEQPTLPMQGLSYCETAIQWFEDWTNDFASPGPTHIDYLNQMATLSPSELAEEWAIYVAAFTTNETAGNDINTIYSQLITHLETECGIDRGSSLQPDLEFAGCWARAIYLIGWGVELDIFNDPAQFQGTLEVAQQNQGNPQGISTLVELIETLYATLGAPPTGSTGPGYGECAPFD